MNLSIPKISKLHWRVLTCNSESGFRLLALRRPLWWCRTADLRGNPISNRAPAIVFHKRNKNWAPGLLDLKPICFVVHETDFSLLRLRIDLIFHWQRFKPGEPLLHYYRNCIARYVHLFLCRDNLGLKTAEFFRTTKHVNKLRKSTAEQVNNWMHRKINQNCRNTEHYRNNSDNNTDTNNDNDNTNNNKIPLMRVFLCATRFETNPFLMRYIVIIQEYGLMQNSRNSIERSA